MKKEGQKGLTGLRGQKVLKKFEGKWQKQWFKALTDRREREKCFEKVWKWLNTWKLKVLKNSLWDFRLIENYIRSIENSFDWFKSNRAAIETVKFKKFNRIFDRSRNKFDRSKIWKTQFFEKQSNFMQKLLKA